MKHYFFNFNPELNSKLLTSHKTVKLLENHYDKINEIEVKSNYNTQTQQIDITVRSPDTRFIAQATS
ncbi:MAG: hypothetical protein RH949_19290 [Coleofasciculus sp. A1-SPW-01]|uniref:hypothetical protein n=1 Tax=Coleofasciculus sp. A1-SPW-01 TaxID=3070819 RepID=UPI003301BB27